MKYFDYIALPTFDNGADGGANEDSSICCTTPDARESRWLPSFSSIWPPSFDMAVLLSFSLVGFLSGVTLVVLASLAEPSTLVAIGLGGLVGASGVALGAAAITTVLLTTSIAAVLGGIYGILRDGSGFGGDGGLGAAGGFGHPGVGGFGGF